MEQPDGTVSVTACKGCHLAEAEAWAGSRHAQARTNAIFQAAMRGAIHPQWCLDCHSPVAAVPEEGVNCAACHARGGVILAGGPPSERGLAAHPMREEPALRSSAFCSGCHQFDLPKGHPMFSDVPVQATFEEWEASPAAAEGKTCQACHLDGHGFPGAHTPELVREALVVDVVRDGERVIFTASAPGMGHPIPTGDPFRRLEWRVCADEACEEVVGRRLIAVAHAPDPWRIAIDRRIPPDGTLTLEMPIPADPGLTWALDYRYGDERLEPELEPADVGYRVASGTLP